jgi:hypothetical protein
MNIKVVDGNWIALIRAMKVNGKEWPTLNRLTWHEADSLAGTDFKTALESLGATELDIYGKLSSSAGKSQANDIAVQCGAGNAEVIAYVYAVTRPEAIMQQFGINAPKAVS